MNYRRLTVLLVSVGGGLRIPLFAGDRITLHRQKERLSYIWRPLCDDGKTLDLTRTRKGPHGERHLHQRFFEALRLGNNLDLVHEGEYVIRINEAVQESIAEKKPEAIKVVTNGKRKPLLRLPVRGLPPRWC